MNKAAGPHTGVCREPAQKQQSFRPPASAARNCVSAACSSPRRSRASPKKKRGAAARGSHWTARWYCCAASGHCWRASANWPSTSHPRQSRGSSANALATAVCACASSPPAASASPRLSQAAASLGCACSRRRALCTACSVVSIAAALSLGLIGGPPARELCASARPPPAAQLARRASASTQDLVWALVRFGHARRAMA